MIKLKISFGIVYNIYIDIILKQHGSFSCKLLFNFHKRLYKLYPKIFSNKFDIRNSIVYI